MEQTPSPALRAQDRRRYRDNLQREVDGAAVYAALAESESDPNTADIYRGLGATELRHAEFWRKKLGGALPKPGLQARLLRFFGRRFGASFVLPMLMAGEVRNSSVYDHQPDAVSAGLSKDERAHARVLSAARATGGGASGAALARLEGRHRGAGGNALRAAVLGANDGLVSNLSLVMGVAGASANDGLIALTGMAGLVAGACSMAMGEWLSVSSARELYEKQIAIEAEELANAPEEEEGELALIYQAKGLDKPSAERLAKQILSRKDMALEVLVREELGIDPKELGGSAWEAAISSFLLFAFGALFPLLPFLVLNGMPAFVASIALSGAALACIGLGTSLFTGRGALASALRQVLIGYAAALVTYGAGAAVGVSLN